MGIPKEEMGDRMIKHPDCEFQDGSYPCDYQDGGELPDCKLCQKIRKAGIREVVEWFMRRMEHIDEPSMTPYYRFDFLEHELEPKLKEWDIW